MAKAKETMADIIAEMRRYAHGATAHIRFYYTLDDAAESMREFAGRIEAAWKREKAEWESAACAFVSDAVMSGKVAVEHAPVDNAAAMRESLVKIREDAAFHTLGGAMNPWKIFEICESALSAPARNCDRDLSDRQSIWKEFCQWVRSSSLGCASDPSAGDAFEWLLAPAAERKGESDGK